MNASNKNHEPTTIDDLQNRLIDRGLAELIGHQIPPDLNARILAANIRLAPASMPASKTRSSRPFWVSLAVAAMLLVGATMLLLPSVQSARESARSSAIKDRLSTNSSFQSQETSENVRLMRGAAVRDDAGLQVETALSDQNLPVAVAAEGRKSTSREVSRWSATGPTPEDGRAFRTNSGTPQVRTSLEASGLKEAELAQMSQQNEHYSKKDLGEAANYFFSHDGRQAPRAATTTTTAGIAPAADFPQFTEEVTTSGDGLAVVRLQELARVEGKGRVLLESHAWDDRLGDHGLPTDGTAEGIGPGLPGDQYTRIFENPFVKAKGGAAVSTFSIDVDTASYANVRQFLMQMNTLPPPDAVRIEELINYFDYNYAGPPADAADTPTAPGSAGGSEGAADSEGSESSPFAAHVEVAGCPWAPNHRLVRIGIKGREIDPDKRPKSNLVFLVDVSGSMNEPAKLPLVVYGLEQLTRELGENDRVAIVVYASSEGLVLPSTSGDKQAEILAALAKLQAGGSTAGGAGIQLAYQLAEDNFIEGGTNRVILCTDGDFNVGVTSTAELERMVEQKAKDTGVFLSVLGFGRGNLNDAMMEAISNHGNGNYSYVDNRTESRRVLVEEMAGTLVTIAKDVKIQVEFNPRQVGGYRLIGYENRMLRTEDFNDDKKDAGEIGAGHTVTALYEIVPAGKPVAVGPVDDLKYQQSSEGEPGAVAADIGGELLTLKMRYKQPDGDTSHKLEWPVTDDGKAFSAATGDFQFAAAVAGFGLLLRDSQYKGNLTYAAALELAQGGVGSDEHGYRGEFLEMIRRAKTLRAE